MVKLKLLILPILALLLLSIPGEIWAATNGVGPVAPRRGEHRPAELQYSPEPGRIVLILLDRTSIGDLNDKNLPNVELLARTGAFGLMNSNTAGVNSPDNTHATLGAGGPMLATGTAPMAYNAYDAAEQQLAAIEYHRRTGTLPPADSVVQLGIARIHRLNAGTPYPSKPGALGEALGKGELRTAVLGNADSVNGQIGRAHV